LCEYFYALLKVFLGIVFLSAQPVVNVYMPVCLPVASTMHQLTFEFVMSLERRHVYVAVNSHADHDGIEHLSFRFFAVGAAVICQQTKEL